jgi:NAD(P)-dependent dehydrogenase (short-subunit alcohol dehydrogenase family)
MSTGVYCVQTLMVIRSQTMIIAKADVSRNALHGKVAVVTGAGQGIGKEAARALAYLGASVVIAELKDNGRETAQQIHAEGGQALFVQTDVSDPASVANLHRQINETFGDVDILVNNAEAFKTAAILEYSVADWDRVMAVNLRGAFLTIKEFLPAMLVRRSGVILTMQSADAMPYMVPYVASKVGLRAVAASLAIEVGEQSGVSVYCFGAGMVNTPGAMEGFRQLAPRFGMTLDEFIQQSAPDGKLADPEVVAAGMIGTILYANEFHGQETIYTAGLIKLGLTADGERQQNGLATSSTLPQSTIPLATLQQALTLNRKLEDVLQANIKEYNGFTMFMRQWAKRDFQQGTGLKVEDWLADAQSMSQQLANAAGGNSAAVPPAKLAAYVAQVRRMESFIAKQETNARGWLKDPQKLSVALAALDERKQTVQQLAGVLDNIG